jgi:hypothetical protein
MKKMYLIKLYIVSFALLLYLLLQLKGVLNVLILAEVLLYPATFCDDANTISTLMLQRDNTLV